MATSAKIHLTVNDTGVVRFKPQTEETAARTSELLQKNHENHHVFFNSEGFHNHIAHHLLTLYGLGAPASIIEKQYKQDASYQLPQGRINQDIVDNLSDEQTFNKSLGKGPRYQDFLFFYQKEMDSKGWEQVLQEYVFSGAAKADDMLLRMFAGLLHPIIHLGFGVEFNQPAVIAEALAQASVHDLSMKRLLLPAEEAAKKNGNIKKTLPQLINDIRANDKIRNSVHFDDVNKLRDGLFTRAMDEIIQLVSEWIVTPETLQAKTAEMQNASVYFAACAQKRPKEVKFDFFYIHSTNSSIFWDAFNAASWLTQEQKVRLLEWKGRMDLAIYVSRGCPALPLEEVTTYVPKFLEAGDAEWPGLVDRVFHKDDDGHAVKLLRAIANAEKNSKKYVDEDWATVKDWMWLKVGNMAVDSLEKAGPDSEYWVRNCGFDEAWEKVKERPRQAHI